MATFISLYVNLLAVPAVLTLAVLVLPMPQRAKELVRGAVQKVLFHEIHVGVKMSVYRLLFILTAVTLAGTVHDSRKASSHVRNAGDYGNTLPLAKKWRAERNVWIALFSFTCWVVVYRVNTFLQQISKLQEKLAARTASDGKPTANKKQD